MRSPWIPSDCEDSLEESEDCCPTPPGVEHAAREAAMAKAAHTDRVRLSRLEELCRIVALLMFFLV